MKLQLVLPFLPLLTSTLTSCGESSASGGQLKTQDTVTPATTSEAATPGPGGDPGQQFKDYWYQGKAEMNHYDLQQGRYGDVYPGDAVLIFVTENMHNQLQVKTDDAGAAQTPILKVNFNRKFWTGIYPYSILTSSCLPVDGAPALKVSSSCEEWCGHTYMQANRRGNKYTGILHSYFPDEADKTFQLGAETLEDEIWVLTRTWPDKLPVGNFRMVPGFHYLRMMHKEMKAVDAVAEVNVITDVKWSESPVRVWKVNYPSLSRKLEIFSEKDFPFAILGWEETHPSFNGKPLTTRAKRSHVMMLDYWNYNSPADSTLRKQLGL